MYKHSCVQPKLLILSSLAGQINILHSLYSKKSRVGVRWVTLVNWRGVCLGLWQLKTSLGCSAAASSLALGSSFPWVAQFVSHLFWDARCPKTREFAFRVLREPLTPTLLLIWLLWSRFMGSVLTYPEGTLTCLQGRESVWNALQAPEQ